MAIWMFVKSLFSSFFSGLKTVFITLIQHWRETLIGILLLFAYFKMQTISELELEIAKKNNALNLCQAVVMEKEQESLDLREAIKKQNIIIDDLNTRTKVQENKLEEAKEKIAVLDAELIGTISDISNDGIVSCEDNMSWMVDRALEDLK